MIVASAMGSFTYFGSTKDPVTVVIHCYGILFNPYGLSLSTSI
jgi:hypothetical protein